jgi:poly(glycerol-phosphate) alpha-glucosyltransferase
LPVLMTPQCNVPVGFEMGASMRIDPEVESITRGISSLLAMTESERRAIGDRGRALAASQFRWDAIARQMLAVYSWVLGKGQRPSYVIED